MEKIKVKTSDLLTKVKQNREGHRAIFEEALEGYRIEVIKQLEISLEEARKGRRFRTYIELVEPADHTKDYDRIIAMLEMTVDATIELTQKEFSQYVTDEWHWMRDFITNVSNYSGNIGLG